MSTAVDAAVVALLQADATLLGLAPGGVYPEMAPEKNPTPFVIVALETHDDVREFGGTAYEDAIYMVTAIDKANDAAAVNAVYARAHTVLGTPLSVSGYTTMDVVRLGRVRFAEREGSVIWRFVGGRYRVQMDPT